MDLWLTVSPRRMRSTHSCALEIARIREGTSCGLAPWRIGRQDQAQISATPFQLGSRFNRDHFLRIVDRVFRIVTYAQHSLAKSRSNDFNLDSIVMNNNPLHHGLEQGIEPCLRRLCSHSRDTSVTALISGDGPSTSTRMSSKRCGDRSNKVSCESTNFSISDAGIRTGPLCFFPRILDYSLGDIVAIAPSFLGCVRRCEAIALLVIEKAHQQSFVRWLSAASGAPGDWTGTFACTWSHSFDR